MATGSQEIAKVSEALGLTHSAKPFQYLADLGLIAPSGIMGAHGFYYFTAHGEQYVRALRAEWNGRNEPELKDVESSKFVKLAGKVKDVAVQIGTDVLAAYIKAQAGLP